MRALIFGAVTNEWKAAYEAGVFAEFMEQRAPGQTVLDDKIYRKGLLDFIADIDQALTALDYLDEPEAYAREMRKDHRPVAREGAKFFPCAPPRAKRPGRL